MNAKNDFTICGDRECHGEDPKNYNERFASRQRNENKFVEKH